MSVSNDELRDDDLSDDLHDPALWRALDHAPDQGAIIDWRLRKSILKAAHEAVGAFDADTASQELEAASRPWWQRWGLWPSKASKGEGGGSRMPWNAAFATVLVGVLVTLVWQREPVPGAQLDEAAPSAAAPRTGGAARAPASPAAPAASASPAAPAAPASEVPAQAGMPGGAPATAAGAAESASSSSSLASTPSASPVSPVSPVSPAGPLPASPASPALPAEAPAKAATPTAPAGAAPPVASPPAAQAPEPELPPSLVLPRIDSYANAPPPPAPPAPAETRDSRALRDAQGKAMPLPAPSPSPSLAARPIAPVLPAAPAAPAATTPPPFVPPADVDARARKEAEASAGAPRALGAARAPSATVRTDATEPPSFAALSAWNRITITPRGGASRSLPRAEVRELNPLLGSAALTATGPQSLVGAPEWRVVLERNGEMLAVFEIARGQVRWREGNAPPATGAPSAAALAALREALQGAVDRPEAAPVEAPRTEPPRNVPPKSDSSNSAAPSAPEPAALPLPEPAPPRQP